MQSIGFQTPLIVNRALPQKIDPGFGHSQKLLHQSAEPTTSPVNSAYHYHPVQFSGKERTNKIQKEYLPEILNRLPKTSSGHEITMGDFNFYEPTSDYTLPEFKISQLIKPDFATEKAEMARIGHHLQQSGDPATKVIFVETEKGEWEKDIASHTPDKINQLVEDLRTKATNLTLGSKREALQITLPVGNAKHKNKKLIFITTNMEIYDVLLNDYRTQALAAIEAKNKK